MPTVKIKNYDPLPPDTYHLQINGCIEREGDNGPYYQWEIEVVEEESAELGRTFNYLTAVAFGPASKAYKFLRAAGMGEVAADVEFDSDEFIGCQFVAKIVTKTTKRGAETNDFEALWTIDEYQAEVEKVAARLKKSGFQKPTSAVVQKSSGVGTKSVMQKSSGHKTVSASKKVVEEEDADSGLNFPE